MIYFAPEGPEQYGAARLRSSSAIRALRVLPPAGPAAMGAVSPSVVQAAFFQLLGPAP
jgi:hypothetical protein